MGTFCEIKTIQDFFFCLASLKRSVNLTTKLLSQNFSQKRTDEFVCLCWQSGITWNLKFGVQVSSVLRSSDLWVSAKQYNASPTLVRYIYNSHNTFSALWPFFKTKNRQIDIVIVYIDHGQWLTVKNNNLILIGCLEFRIILLVFRTFLLTKYSLWNVFKNNFLKSSSFNIEISSSFLISWTICTILKILST